MSQTFEYRIVSETNAYDLAKSVTGLIRDGWKPQGGVSVFTAGFREYFFQAVVK